MKMVKMVLFSILSVGSVRFKVIFFNKLRSKFCVICIRLRGTGYLINFSNFFFQSKNFVLKSVQKNFIYHSELASNGRIFKVYTSTKNIKKMKNSKQDGYNGNLNNTFNQFKTF